MNQSLVMFLIFAAPIIAAGVLLIALARWSRRRNAELQSRARGSSTQSVGASSNAFDQAWGRGHFRASCRALFLSELSPFEAVLGKFLAMAVVILVSGALLALVALIAWRSLR